MEQRNIKILQDLLKRPGNGQCAECGSREVEYASYNIGIFLCPRCTLLHNQMGSHISKTKHLKLDHWEDSQIERMKQVGNQVARLKYEARVPAGFRKPNANASTSLLPPDPQILLEHWITSKYVREEFTQPQTTSTHHHQFIGDPISTTSPQQQQQQQTQQAPDSSLTTSSPLRPYLSGWMDSFLMKKGREDFRYFPRRFVLDNATLRYFVKENRNPKAVIRLVDLDVNLSPASKTGRVGSLQLSYLKDGTTRNIFVSHEDSEIAMQWYQAIRIGKLAALRAKCSAAGVYVPENVLLTILPQDSLMEGYLWKAGPSPSYAHRRRWFTLSPRKLSYHLDPLDAYPKGEIFLGTHSSSSDPQQQSLIDQYTHIASKIYDIDIKPPVNLSGYKVSVGGFGDDKMDAARWVFSLHTPYRTFILAAETQSERDKWVKCIDQVLKGELSPRDVATCSLLVRKRNGSALGSISVSNPLSGLLSSSSSPSSHATSPPGGLYTTTGSGGGSVGGGVIR